MADSLLYRVGPSDRGEAPSNLLQPVLKQPQATSDAKENFAGGAAVCRGGINEGASSEGCGLKVYVKSNSMLLNSSRASANIVEAIGRMSGRLVIAANAL